MAETDESELLSLPPEVLFHILDLVGHRGLATVRLVSKALLAAASDPMLYRRVSYKAAPGPTWKRLAAAPHVMAGVTCLELGTWEADDHEYSQEASMFHDDLFLNLEWIADQVAAGSLPHLVGLSLPSTDVQSRQLSCLPPSLTAIRLGLPALVDDELDALPSCLELLEVACLGGAASLDRFGAFDRLRRLVVGSCRTEAFFDRMVGILAASRCAGVLEALSLDGAQPGGDGLWVDDVASLTALRELAFLSTSVQTIEEHMASACPQLAVLQVSLTRKVVSLDLAAAFPDLVHLDLWSRLQIDVEWPPRLQTACLGALSRCVWAPPSVTVLLEACPDLRTLRVPTRQVATMISLLSDLAPKRRHRLMVEVRSPSVDPEAVADALADVAGLSVAASLSATVRWEPGSPVRFGVLG